ncbi:hypothetical protein C823_004142 [Eubacterium plexicaudatum ASF492]|nr:hypothetical protein C823_004142 [Eubacterium plexicaudatum ASF492]
MEYLEKAQNAIINEAEFQKSVENLLIHSKNKSRFKKIQHSFQQAVLILQTIQIRVCDVPNFLKKI